MKISRPVYLLIVLIEECAEVIHRACKAIRFGMDDVQKPKESGEVFDNNRDRLKMELADLRTAIHLLERDGVLPEIRISVNKMLKVEKYHEFSIALGQAEGPPLSVHPELEHPKWDKALPGTDKTVRKEYTGKHTGKRKIADNEDEDDITT